MRLARESTRQALPSLQRERVGVLLALATVVCVGAAYVLTNGMTLLMPGPLSSAHGTLETCSTCHAKSGNGKLSWVQGLVPGDPHADSKACLTCHKMPETAFNAHSAPAEVLKQSTQRLTKIAERTPQPHSARVQSIAFPTDEAVARGLNCATCHQEHQGTKAKLKTISDAQCRSCHVVKFDSFDGDHPKFENYPFKSRTRIVYDHAGHFGKHYPEVAKKGATNLIPATCATCHNSRDDKRIMAVAPFEKTCANCHLDQIKGKERVSGPKGIAFLTLPSLDLQTLKKKKAAIGEWPDASEAALSPFMKVMVSRNERGRALITAVEKLNLQDLSSANEQQIRTVTDLVWEIKTLYFSLISRKASDVLGDLSIGGSGKLSANLVADLTASIPRDVIITAQQQWLPNLAVEIANGPGARDPQPSDQQPDGWSAVTVYDEITKPATARSASRDENAPSDAGQDPAKDNPSDAATKDTTTAQTDPPPCLVSILGQCLLFKGAEPSQPQATATAPSTANSKPDDTKSARTFRELPPPANLGLSTLASTVPSPPQTVKTGGASAKPETATAPLPSNKQPQGKASDQTDDLLFPTPDEVRDITARNKAAGKSVQPMDASIATGAAPSAPPPASRSVAAPVVSIANTLDPENWAEYGGWYQQDHAIFYRPTGHKDKFVFAWLTLTGPYAPAGDTTPPAAVFEYLTRKDAQGSCVKCHSVDEVQGQARTVNFSPLTLAQKQGRFTRFIHEPHFATTGDRGCLTCHKLSKDQPYLKSYEQNNPHNFAPEFGTVTKDSCQNCHKSSMARQDCLTCHKYHVNDVITPITNTKLLPP
jgi:hypothetical protein